MATSRVFLASSSELKADRDEFEIFINRKNKEWHARGTFLDLVTWEDFLDAMSQTRLQDEYNKAIRDCDVFVMLFATKVGKFTQEEFEVAFGQFKATGKPFIFTYFKDTAISTGNANRQDLMSLLAFQEKLRRLGHYQTQYQNVDALKLHFAQQLDKLAANGFITFEPDREDGASAHGWAHEATLTGSGATAQGPGAQAAGQGAVVIGGQSTGTINTGTMTTVNTDGGFNVAGGVATGGGAFVGGGVTVGHGDFVGRDKIVTGLSPGDLDALFAPLIAVIRGQQGFASPDQSATLQQVHELKAEVAKGTSAADTKVARIVDGLVRLVPSAIGSVISMFATPLLGAIAGPLTKGILDRLKQR